jgi:hypothetical protein
LANANDWKELLVGAWTIDDVIAREQIRDVVTRYNVLCDSGRFDEMAMCFAPDAHFREELMGHEAVDCTGRAEIRAAIDAVRLEWETTSGESRGLFIRHCVSTHRISLEGDRLAVGSAYVLVVRDHGLHHWGRYKDRYVELNGEWLISDRVARMEGPAPTATLL